MRRLSGEVRASAMCLAMACAPAWAQGSPSPEKTDLSIGEIRLSPPSGSSVKAHQPIFVTFRYRYSKPYYPMRVWAKILDESLDSVYQGSLDAMQPGAGTIERFVLLKKPGRINTITIVAKDSQFREIYTKAIPVRYDVVANPLHEAEVNDGTGSTIEMIGFKPRSPGDLKPGDDIEVQLAYDIRSSGGLTPWALPVTKCAMTYSGAPTIINGKGTVSMYIKIGEPCTLKQVKYGLSNRRFTAVAEKTVDVEFRFKD